MIDALEAHAQTDDRSVLVTEVQQAGSQHPTQRLVAVIGGIARRVGASEDRRYGLATARECRRNGRSLTTRSVVSMERACAFCGHDPTTRYPSLFRLSLSLEVARLLRPLMSTIRSHDRSLERQLRGAASSVCLNIAESRGRAGRDRVQFLRIALDSAGETTGCLN